MPVVAIDLERFGRLVGADRRKILERLPYVGLDIESVSDRTIRVEYSPNRPDFGTDYGIARALRGLMGIEVGLPRYKLASSGIVVDVDRVLASVRPYIACATVSGLRMDDEDIRQIISLQEDLHNGLGRRRRRVAIGLHDLKALTPPIGYRAMPPTFRFAPLGSEREMTIRDILSGTETGRLYASALAGAQKYPVLVDANNLVLSFPPIINGKATKVTEDTSSLFIDVTSLDMRAGDDVLAIITTTLADMGGKLGSVLINYGRNKRITPELEISEIPLDPEMIQEVTGLNLSKQQLTSCIRKSRMDVRGREVLIPRYRIDILHPVDIAEEVALGYGIDRIDPEYPPSKQPGALNPSVQFLGEAASIMAGLGMIELMTYELVDERSLYTNFGRLAAAKITVEDPKSIDHSLLRDSLVPCLLSALSSNVKEEYPQRVFEIGRVYGRIDNTVAETWHLACLVAHAQSSFSEARMYLDSFCRTMVGLNSLTTARDHWAFAPGRSAAVSVEGRELGFAGELKPEALAASGINMPVCAFEIDLSVLSKQLK